MTVRILRSRRYLRLLMPLLVLLTALALPSSRGALAEPTLPLKTAWVVDVADVLRSNQEQSLNAQLDRLKQRSSVELVVVTLPNLQGYSIEQWGRALGEGWNVGGKNGLGALLIVAPNDRQVRIEVGDALSGLITDREASTIIETRIIPQFRSGEMSGGVLAGIDAMIQEAMPPMAPKPVTSSSSQSSHYTPTPTRASGTVVFITVGVVLLVLALWVAQHSEIFTGLANGSGDRDSDDDWVTVRRDRRYGSSNRGSSYSFGSSGSSPSSSSGSSRSSWSGSGSSGSWGSSRSSSSSSHSSSSSSGGRSSGGFSGRGASGRW